jgi:hypothetical protein
MQEANLALQNKLSLMRTGQRPCRDSLGLPADDESFLQSQE